MRPFTSHVEDLSDRQTSCSRCDGRSASSFIASRSATPQGNLLGAIQRKWTWFRRKYMVEGPNGQEVATLFGPFFRPWTFKILLPGSEQEVGLIQKKWSGLLKEAFTEADNFWVEYEAVTDPQAARRCCSRRRC